MRGNQIAVEQIFLGCRLRGKDDQHQIDIGGDRFEVSSAIRPLQHAAAGYQRVNSARFFGGHPQHLVARHRRFKMGPQVTQHSVTCARLDECLLAVACNDQSRLDI